MKTFVLWCEKVRCMKLFIFSLKIVCILMRNDFFNLYPANSQSTSPQHTMGHEYFSEHGTAVEIDVFWWRIDDVSSEKILKSYPEFFWMSVNKICYEIFETKRAFQYNCKTHDNFSISDIFGDYSQISFCQLAYLISDFLFSYTDIRFHDFFSFPRAVFPRGKVNSPYNDSLDTLCRYTAMFTFKWIFLQAWRSLF